MVWLKRN